MKCSVCREIKPWLTKIGSALLCETCRLDSERQLQRNDVVIKDEVRDTSPAETYNQNLEGTTYIKDEPVSMGETQDQAQLVGFSNGSASHAIKSEIYDSDGVDSNQYDMDGEENTDETSNQTLSDIELQNEEIQIKDELPAEESKDQNIDDKCANPEKVNCNFCSYSCATRHIMKYHLIANHPVERLMGCSICGKKCQGKSLYQQHLQEKHNGFGADCKICLEMFREPGEVKPHRKHCLGRLLFICNSCDTSYVSKESVLKHMDGQCSSAPTKVAAFIEKRIEQLFFTCALCNDGRAFEKEPYWRHIKEVHNGHSIICKYCPTTFKSKDSRSRHIKFNCTVSDCVVRQDLKCPKCVKRFVTQRKLDIHVKSAHSPVKCEICQVVCRNLFSLKYHREKEHTKPNLQCPYCQKKFKVSSIYRHHLKKRHRK